MQIIALRRCGIRRGAALGHLREGGGGEVDRLVREAGITVQ